MNGKDNLFITFIIISKHSLISIHQVQIATADIILYVNQRILCCPGISFSPSRWALHRYTSAFSINVAAFDHSDFFPLWYNRIQNNLMKILYLFYLLKDFGSRSRRLCQFTHFKTQARLFRKHDISP